MKTVYIKNINNNKILSECYYINGKLNEFKEYCTNKLNIECYYINDFKRYLEFNFIFFLSKFAII